jgi:Glycosyl hydrolase family 76
MKYRPLLAAFLAALVALLAVEPTATADPMSRQQYLRAAATAESLADKWWDSHTAMFKLQLGNSGPATIWGGQVHMFELADALAIADPTPARKNRVRWFARNAERFWDPNLPPSGGYTPTPGSRWSKSRAWFDDNGWWGIAFYDAYRATRDPRYLSSAKRALTFIDQAGWDRQGGGIWWDTRHSFHAGESLATAVLLAASLYHETRAPRYIGMVRKYITWANKHVKGMDGLYDRHDTDETPMPYVQGPIANGFILLCDATRDRTWCNRAEKLADASAQRFPTLTMGPQFDSMYVRALLELYRYDHNRRWYDIAAREVQRAMANARDSSGVYSKTWAGRSIRSVDNTPPGRLQTHAATSMTIAWMAATPLPR